MYFSFPLNINILLFQQHKTVSTNFQIGFFHSQHVNYIAFIESTDIIVDKTDKWKLLSLVLKWTCDFFCQSKKKTPILGITFRDRDTFVKKFEVFFLVHFLTQCPKNLLRCLCLCVTDRVVIKISTFSSSNNLGLLFCLLGKKTWLFLKWPVPSQEDGSYFQQVPFYVCCIIVWFCCT